MTRERAKELLPVITAYAEGKTVQRTPGFVNDWSDDCSPTLDSAYKYRIKPEPRLRPWRPEEVPVGRTVRRKGIDEVLMVMSRQGDCVDLPVLGVQTVGTLFRSFELCDGKPCGVEEP